MYINSPEQLLIDNHCGIDFGGYKMGQSLYADDAILLSGFRMHWILYQIILF